MSGSVIAKRFGDKFLWHDYLMLTLLQDTSRDMVHGSLLCDSGTDSDFSGGADAFGMGCNFLEAAGEHHGIPVNLPVHTTCEFNPNMRKVAIPRLSPMTCQFDSIYDIFGDPDFYWQAMMNIESIQEKYEFTQNIPVYSHATCCAHGCMCRIISGGCARASGPPCQDWSRVNRRSDEHKGLLGPQLPTLFAEGRKCNVCKNLAVVWENVPALPDWLVDLCLGDDYVCESKIQLPEHCGFTCIGRPRNHYIVFTKALNSLI